MSVSGHPLPNGAIPYVEHHEGERRLLTLQVTTQNVMASGRFWPVVSIDGRSYVVFWGFMTFEIPADRSCHVAVYIQADAMTQAASLLLPPGRDVTLVYATDFATGLGRLGPAA